MQPRIFSYCSTFLNQEMLHVYRQMSNIVSFENYVITRTRKNRDQFSYDRIIQIQKDPLRWIPRLLCQMARKHRIPLSGFEIRQLLKHTDRLKPELIHIYLGTEAVRLLPYLKKANLAKVVSFHGADLSEDLLPREFEQLLEWSSLFLCRSRSLKEALEARGCPSDKICLNPTGVEIPEEPVRREPLNISTQDPLYMLQACRFVGKKGLKMTLQATALLHQRGIPVRLILAGDGPRKAELVDWAEKLGIKFLVKFTGFIPHQKLRNLFQDSHLFLHPSMMTESGDREGIPNAILEAMAYGLPVIATRHSGIPEAITHMEEGLLVEEGSAESIADAVQYLLDKPEVYQRLSEKSYEKVKNEYSIGVCIENLEAAYRKAILMR